MANIYICLRYVIYGLFVACNAIIASISVWGLSLAQAASASVPSAPYMIFVGSFAIVVIFSIIFTELLRRNAITSKVWFECAWTGLFLVLEMVGASLISADPSSFCPIDTFTVQGSCTSASRAVLGFAWLITVLLIFYFSILLMRSIMEHRKNGPSVWMNNVRTLLPFNDVTPTPMNEASFQSLNIVAPKPRHPLPNLGRTYHSGLSQYEIEYYQPPSPPPVPPLPQPSTSLYPQYLQPTLTSHPYATSHNIQGTTSFPASPDLPSPPPPLGNWPRADVLTQSAQGQAQAATDNRTKENIRPLPALPSKLMGPRDRALSPTGPGHTTVDLEPQGSNGKIW